MKQLRQKEHKFVRTVLILLATIIGTGCSSTNDNNEGELNDAEKAQLLERAYVYTLPLMLMDATYIKMTNVEEPVAQQAPANRLIHCRHQLHPGDA